MPRSEKQRRARSAGWWWAAAALMIIAAGCGGAEAASEDATPATIASSDGDTATDTLDETDGGQEPEGPTSSVETDDGTTNDSTTGDEAATDPDDDDAGAIQDGSADGDDEQDQEDSTGEDSTEDDPEPNREPTGPLLDQVGPDDRGDEVAALQHRLAELGFDPGPADGDYGRRTLNAVQVFQELNRLPPTGRADRRTVEALATYRYDGLFLAAGDEGDDVEELQRRLADGPFDPGSADGVYGGATVAAVWALEKLAGIPVDGDWGPADELAWQRLMDGQIGQPERDHEQRWVEVDLSQQLMKVYDPGSTTPILVSHASSGSGIPWENEEHRGSSITPLGDFHINRRINGWRESSLDIGRLYNPLYFNGGIAFHGATSVPLYPASHGCIRLPMHVADYLPSELPNGTPVHVLA